MKGHTHSPKSGGQEARQTKIPFFKSLKSVLLSAKVIFRLDRRNIPAFVGNQFLITLQPFAALFFSARILDVLSAGADRQTVVNWILAAVICNYGIYLLERLTACSASVEGITLYWQLYQEMSRVMMRADYEELEKPDIGLAKERIERSTRMFWYGPWEVPGVLMSIVKGLTIVAASLGLAWPVFMPAAGEGVPWGTILMALFIAASVCYSIAAENRLYRMKEEGLDKMAAQMRRSDFLYGYAREDRGAKDIRLYSQQKMIWKQARDIFGRIEELSRERADLRSRSNGIRGAMSQAVVCLAYLAVGLRALAGVFSVGSVVQYVGAVTQLSEGIRMLVYSLQHVRMQGPHCQEYLDFIGEGNDPKQYRHHQDGTRPVESAEDWEIVFENVSFRYPGNEEWALQDLSIRLKKGCHYALVGMNGSGKTTFVKLLCRLYDPTKGRILLNGRDIREYTAEEYQRLFAVVFQDFQLFALPLGENVAASMRYDEKRVLESLDKAGIGDWAEKLAKGLKQPLYTVEEDGVNVSGGEAQKIAIARALYKNAPFVVLDEPTAALDPIAEADIYSRFREMTDRKGALYISHRLSSCRFCDTIAVFHEGKLVQEGSHEDLLAHEEGRYAQLWQAQAQWYR